MFSSFSSSMSLREALTLLETSFPCEKSLWRSLNVRFSGAPAIEFSWSDPLKQKNKNMHNCRLKMCSQRLINRWIFLLVLLLYIRRKYGPIPPCMRKYYTPLTKPRPHRRHAILFSLWHSPRVTSSHWKRRFRSVILLVYALLGFS